MGFFRRRRRRSVLVQLYAPSGEPFGPVREADPGGGTVDFEDVEGIAAGVIIIGPSGAVRVPFDQPGPTGEQEVEW